jgi:hypothetical protein
MKHVTHGGESAQVTDEFSHLKSDVRTEHLQRLLTRYMDKFLAEEGIENKGPGSRIVVRRAFESDAILISVDLLAGYHRDECPPNPCLGDDGNLIFGDYYVERGYPLAKEPQYAYWEVRQTGAALPYATFFDNPLLPQSKARAIEYARALHAEYIKKHGRAA